ncbi:TPA: hypothetical protein HA251_05960 [Candidatus Woesearchaeota archaeon]|nr:hypothetical protein [Candidatus Woesearchaeota archaeon]
MRPTINEDAEREQRVSVPLDESVERALQIYRNVDYEDNKYAMHDYIRSKYQELFLPLLSPAQIDIVLHKIIAQTPKEKLFDGMTGDYFSELVKRSYNEGNNNFVLTTNDTSIDNLPTRISGTKNTPLHILVSGNLGRFAAKKTQYIDLIVRGDIGHFFCCDAEHSVFTLYGVMKGNFFFRPQIVSLMLHGRTSTQK